MTHDTSTGPATVEPFADGGRVVRLTLSGRAIGLPLEEIGGLAEPGTTRPVPGAADVILGVAEWRGRVVTIVDLRSLLELAPACASDRGAWLRLAAPREHLVLRVDGAVSLSTPARSVQVGRPAGSLGCLRPSVRDGESIDLIDPHAVVRALELRQRRADGDSPRRGRVR